jgi:acylphosphatase
MNQQVLICVCGLVQGVFFRASALREARRLKLTGYAQNLPNGAVEICAEGKEEDLGALITWCQKGPGSARVEKVETTWLDASGRFTTFDIK